MEFSEMVNIHYEWFNLAYEMHILAIIDRLKR